jgi:hypothetical protein
VSSSFLISHGPDIMLTIAICVILGALILAIVRSKRPDPKMALLWQLMRDFPVSNSERIGRL